MLRNEICPYCGVRMITESNRDKSRTAEHMIPHAMLTAKRTRAESDFYACRRCNSDKSDLDFRLGLVAKSQSENATVAVDSVLQGLAKPDRRVTQVQRMLSTAVELPEGGAIMTVPFTGPELIRYITYLGRGQFFKERKTVYDRSTHVFEFFWIPKTDLGSFAKAYKNELGSDPIDDLMLNLGSEVITNGECIVHTKDSEYLFVLHRVVVIGIRVLKRTRSNRAREIDSIRKIVRGFS
jgi:hypothetical protein